VSEPTMNYDKTTNSHYPSLLFYCHSSTLTSSLLFIIIVITVTFFYSFHGIEFIFLDFFFYFLENYLINNNIALKRKYN
jgi:hypothetical protein